MDLSELYRDIVESSPDGIWVLDLEGRTLYTNPEIARIHRIPQEELAGLTVFDTLDEDGRDRILEAFQTHYHPGSAGSVSETALEQGDEETDEDEDGQDPGRED